MFKILTRLISGSTKSQVTETPKAEQFFNLLSSDNPGVRAGAVWRLRKINTERSAKVIIDALKDRHYFVREIAANALGEINARETISALKEALNDKNLLVREAAVEALQKINSKN